MSDEKKPNPMSMVACDPSESKDASIIMQMLLILADGCKTLPAGHDYTMTATTGFYEPLGREAFMLAVEGTPR